MCGCDWVIVGGGRDVGRYKCGCGGVIVGGGRDIGRYMCGCGGVICKMTLHPCIT